MKNVVFSFQLDGIIKKLENLQASPAYPGAVVQPPSPVSHADEFKMPFKECKLSLLKDRKKP